LPAVYRQAAYSCYDLKNRSTTRHELLHAAKMLASDILPLAPIVFVYIMRRGDTTSLKTILAKCLLLAMSFRRTPTPRLRRASEVMVGSYETDQPHCVAIRC
jgi:hypothetical protein